MYVALVVRHWLDELGAHHELLLDNDHDGVIVVHSRMIGA